MSVSPLRKENDISGVESRILRLVADPDFGRIREKLAKFNFFEAIGVQRREVRHSDFLAFLLNPRGNHGLGDAFLRRFLKRSFGSKFVYSGKQFQVERETMHVDILLHDDVNHLAVIVENKVDAGEHDNQLERYWKSIKDRYPGYSLFGLYLTPEGEKPSDERYVPVGYSFVCDLIDEMLGREKSKWVPAVEMTLRHYVEMLRRDIVPDSDLRQLCENVYFEHRDVLDQIFEFKPDLQTVIRKYLENLVESEPQKIALDSRSTKRYVRFAAQEWDAIQAFKQGHDNWGDKGRMLLFEFQNEATSLKLKLIIGPGPTATRQKLLDLALANDSLLRAASKSLNAKWNEIYSRPILSESSLDNLRTSDLEEQVKTEWRKFLEEDFPQILRIVGSDRWNHQNQQSPDA
jgi:PD-(D/E)XK nuclease superfamily protein